MILSTHGAYWSDNMKRFLWLVALFLLTPAALADPMDDLIAEYEAYVRDTSPAEAARAAGEAPSAWGNVTPEAVAERAARAEALRDAIAALETDRTTDQAILQRLLAVDIDDARYDAARIPFTGDWGFQAEPIFAAMQTKITTEAEGDAWIARLNDVPRYFAENVANMRRRLAISSSLARSTISRAAMLSSAAQTKIMSRISCLVLRTTKAPRRGIILTSPSCSSRHRASRTGVRLTPNFSDSCRSSSRCCLSLSAYMGSVLMASFKAE